MAIEPLKIPFPAIYPFQRSGNCTIQRANWRGEERDVIVQWHEDRAYFAPLQGEPGVWATLDSCAENDALACFDEAVREKRYGVCFSNFTKIHYGREHFRWMLHFIYAPDGTGLLRERVSRDWIAFAPQETRAWAMFPELELPKQGDKQESFMCCQYAAKSVRDELMFRKIEQEEIEYLSWRSSTTKEEFERVGQLLWQGGFAVKDTQRGRNESLYLSTHYDHPVSPRKMSAYINEAEGTGEFWKWLQSFFWVQGFEWRQTEWGRKRFAKLRAREPYLRAFYEPIPVKWHVSFAGKDEPSFHEQIEARLELREWLRDKASAQDIEKWLKV